MGAVLDPAAFRPRGAERSHAGGAARDEVRLLERCAGEIAKEAGPGASVVELGGAAGGQVCLLKAAVAALAPPGAVRPSAGRRLVFIPAARFHALPADRRVVLLTRIRRMSADDVLLVVGAPTAQVEDLPRFARLAHAAGWQHCQLWSDGSGCYAVHVLEPSTRRANVRGAM